MIKLKDILNEDEKSTNEEPNKLLVKDKKNGLVYYVDKDKFNSSIHERPKGAKAPTKDDKGADDKKEKEKKPAGGGIDLMAGIAAAASSKTEPEDVKKKAGKNATKIQISSYEMDNLVKKSSGLRPDLEDKLVDYNYNKLFDEYNNIQMQGSDEKKLKNVIRKFQTVAIAKFAVIADIENEPQLIQSAVIYRENARQINRMLQKGEKILSKPELIKQIEKKGQPEELTYEFKKSMAIYDMDEHFKSPGSKLDRDVIVYHGVDKSSINKFVKAGRWTDKGFVSTSLNPIISDTPDSPERNPILKIHLKTGDSVLILSKDEDKNFFETEITLPRNCTFVIGNYHPIENSYDVNVEYPNAWR